MRFNLLKTLVLVTVFVLNTQSWASEPRYMVGYGLDDKGEYSGACVVEQGTRVFPKQDAKVSMRLSINVDDEAGYAKRRWLVARIKIEKSEQTPESFRLSKLALFLPYVSLENFRGECGSNIVYGNLMGDEVEVTWLLSDDSGVEKSETLVEQRFTSTQITPSAIEDFAALVDGKLALYTGHIFQWGVAVRPSNLLSTKSCIGVADCFSVGLKKSNTIPPAPLENLVRPLSDEMIRSLQSGSKMPIL